MPGPPWGTAKSAVVGVLKPGWTGWVDPPWWPAGAPAGAAGGGGACEEEEEEEGWGRDSNGLGWVWEEALGVTYESGGARRGGEERRGIVRGREARDGRQRDEEQREEGAATPSARAASPTSPRLSLDGGTSGSSGARAQGRRRRRGRRDEGGTHLVRRPLGPKLEGGAERCRADRRARGRVVVGHAARPTRRGEGVVGEECEGREGTGRREGRDGAGEHQVSKGLARALGRKRRPLERLPAGAPERAGPGRSLSGARGPTGRGRTDLEHGWSEVGAVVVEGVGCDAVGREREREM